MPERCQKLTDATLQEFVTRIRKDPELKKEIIARVSKHDGIAKIVREFFTLSDIQEKNVGTLKGELEQLLKSAVLGALNTGGSIRLTQPDTNLVEPQSTGIHVGVHNGPNGTDLSVDIQCLQ